MTTIEKQSLINLITNCKSELLNHTLQNEIISQHIKQINSYLDESLNTLMHDFENIPDAPKTKKRRSLKGDRGKRNNVLFFAYCMSKWDYPFINSITGNDFNQSEAFKYIAQQLSIKVATLRNYRDTFDSHVEQMRSSRQGWKGSLKEELKQTIAQYNSSSEEELILIGKKILQSYHK